MKRITKRKSLILIASGLFLIAISQIGAYLIELPDVAIGSFIGMGIGLLLTSLFLGNIKTANS